MLIFTYQASPGMKTVIWGTKKEDETDAVTTQSSLHLFFFENDSFVSSTHKLVFSPHLFVLLS